MKIEGLNGRLFAPYQHDGVKWMLVARVLVGEVVEGNGRMRRAEREDGTLVDTAVDDVVEAAVLG